MSKKHFGGEVASSSLRFPFLLPLQVPARDSAAMPFDPGTDHWHAALKA